MSIFEQNLSMLSAYDSAAADRIRQHVPGNHTELMVTPDKKYSLRFTNGDKSFLLHSSRNPIREAQRWVEGFSEQEVFNLLVMGCGLFYHIYELVKQYQVRLRNLVIIEKEPDIIHTAFSCIDLRPLLSSRSIFFLINPSLSEVRESMNDFLTPFILDGLTIVEHPASVAIDPPYYQQLRNVIDESLQSGEILLRTKVQLGSMIQENIIRNIPHMLSNPSLSALHAALGGVPAFIVGAGPSLDKNIDQLREVDDQGVIIASDTVFKLLRSKGIEPHIVVTTDPTYLNSRHFEDVDDLGSTILVFSPSVYHSILDQLQGTKVSIPLPTSRFLQSMKDLFGVTNTMKAGINVGQTCYNLARFLGCDPIILLGFDLSFNAQGGTTHAHGTALRRNIYLSETPGKMKVELISSKPELEEFDPITIPGNKGDRVATNKFWLAYLRSLEEEIGKTNAKVINCTEGGARVEGAEIQPLKETINQHCTHNAMVQSTLQMAVGFFFDINIEEGKSVLNEAKDILQTAIQKAQEGTQKVDALETIFNSPSPDQSLMRETMDEILETHKALAQNQKVYAVLDEAADRILHPFLKQSNRPSNDKPTPKNVEMTINRYRHYFTEMQKLCEHFSTIITETVSGMDSSPSWQNPGW